MTVCLLVTYKKIQSSDKLKYFMSSITLKIKCTNINPYSLRGEMPT